MNTNRLVFGVSGQTGFYVAEQLLAKGFPVVGVVRRSARHADLPSGNTFRSVEADVTDPSSLRSLLREVNPSEIYALAGQSHVKTSFGQPLHTWDVTAAGHLNLLEAVRECCPEAHLVFAASSEMFGSSVDPDGFQRLSTPMIPNSPYAIAKLAGFHATRLYREAYGLYAVNAVLFNHESQRRGEYFLTRKVSKYIGWTVLNKRFNQSNPPLTLGNLKAQRDWSYAGDMAEGLQLILKPERPKDYLFASGETHTVEEFVDTAFREAGLDWQEYVKIDESLFRPAEVDYLRGDSSLARQELGWTPKVDFPGLVKLMVKYDERFHKSPFVAVGD